MPEKRRRRNVKRAVMALAVVVLLAGVWRATPEPPEIERSRALRMGMTRAEVEAVMGEQDGVWGAFYPEPGGVRGGGVAPDGTWSGAYFGKSAALRIRVFYWIGIDPRISHSDWPVRVRFDEEGRINQIKLRGEP